MHRFKDLEVWRQSRKFCTHIYQVTGEYPNTEKFGIVNQLRRASVSVPSNIAEGASRISNKDFSRFLRIALGSCYEIETQLLISNDLEFISNKGLSMLQEKLTSIIKMLSKLVSTLR